MDSYLISLLKYFLPLVSDYVIERVNWGYRITNTLESEGLRLRPYFITYWLKNTLCFSSLTYITKVIISPPPKKIGFIHLYIHHGPENGARQIVDTQEHLLLVSKNFKKS